jgi:hypothetical protein
MPLDLVVPDLLLPAGAPARLAAARLPHAERWLARAELATEPAAGALAWLAAAHGLAEPAPYAAIALAGEGRDAAGEWLRADPVHLRVDQDAVILHDASVLDLAREEADALAAALRGHFARDGLVLDAAAPQRWYVRVPEGERPVTVPLQRANGHNVFGLLPRGSGRINWPALLTEAQMLLGPHDVNAAREPARPAANGVWFWGEGTLPAAVARRYALVHTREPFALGLARLTGAEARQPPASLADVDLVRAGESALAVLDTLTAPLNRGDEDAWLAAAAALDERWFASLEKAIARFDAVRLVLPAGDRVRVATLTASARWRWFHRRKLVAAYA